MLRSNEKCADKMAKPEPLPVWDRRSQRVIQEYLDDHPSTYETRPQKTFTGWFQSHPLIDWGFAAMQHTPRSARQIEPFVKKHRALARVGAQDARIVQRCISIIWSIGIMLSCRWAMIQIDPATIRNTTMMPKASASTLLVLSGPVVM